MTIEYMLCYGTLRKGERAENMMIHSGARYIKDVVVHDMILVDLGSFPGAVRNEGTSIVAELWAVPDTAWPTYDRYEGVDKDNGHKGLYRRRMVTTTSGEMAEIYLLNAGIDEDSAVLINDWKERTRTDEVS